MFCHMCNVHRCVYIIKSSAEELYIGLFAQRIHMRRAQVLCVR